MVLAEVATTTMIYLIAVYYAAFSYHLEWSGMVGVIVLASIVTAYLNRFLLLMTPMGKTKEGEMIVVAIGTIIMYMLSSLIVFIILAYRFSLLTAVGLSMLSGFILYLFKKM